MKLTVFRYDDQDYSDGEVVRPRGDSIDILTANQKVVELGIRALLPDGVNIRATSVYTWENEAVARRLWLLSKKLYLYELEVEEESVRHIGDVDCYSVAVDAVSAGRSPDAAIQAYCNGDVAYPTLDRQPAREILVEEARVLRKIESREPPVTRKIVKA